MEKIIQTLLHKGIELYIDDVQQLKARARKGCMTAQLAGLIKDNKSDLIQYLKSKVADDVQAVSTDIEPVGDLDIIPLSSAQMRFWLASESLGQNTLYNMLTAWRVDGPLSLPLVEKSAKALLQRHEILRTVYVETPSLRQVVRPLDEVDFRCSVHDLCLLNTQEQALECQRLLDAEEQTPFALAQDAMLRIQYIKLSQTQGILAFNMHHIAADGWSMEVFTREFYAFYNSLSKNCDVVLDALSLQYKDYAVWQNQLMESDGFQLQLDYWLKHLEGCPILHSLETVKERPKVKQGIGKRVVSTLDKSVSNDLKKVSTEHNMSPFMLLHGALVLVLSRHSNSSDVVIGTPVANRTKKPLEGLIGCFINTLVLR
ncbi:condensation domain-containing protein, partial [Pseudoalteromonas luteoviolacea]|uniref:condensation domain-containing protein n=1 Tax=Pseudoalteromonas luteoviolacea TaxID=43657 RepID=UPI000AA6185E